MEGMNMYAAAEPKFPEDRFRQYCEVYSRAGGRLTWPECQKAVDAEADAEESPSGRREDYAAELLPEGGDPPLFESGCLMYPVDSAPLMRIDSSGFPLPDNAEPVAYERAPRHARLKPDELRSLAIWLDAPEWEAEAWWDAVLDGVRIRGESWSIAQDKAMAATFGPKPRTPRRQDARESATQTAATRQTVSGTMDSSGNVAFTVEATDVWGPGHASTAPPVPGDGSTSRTTESSRRRQAVPRPLPGERGMPAPVPGSPRPYQRDIETADLTDEEAGEVVKYLEEHPTESWSRAVRCIVGKRRGGARLADQRTKVPDGAPVGPPPESRGIHHERGGAESDDEPFATFAARFSCPGLRVVSRRVRGSIEEPVYEPV
jgi:hypothetical protein